MTHGIAEGVERAPWGPQHDPQPEGRRRRGEGTLVDLGEAGVEVCPTFHFSAPTRSFHLTLECVFPGDSGHMSEGFALAAAACDAVGSILRGEADEDWEDEIVEETAEALVNAVRDKLTEDTREA